MIQYKTTCIPNVPYTGVSKAEYNGGLTVSSANAAIAPIGKAIENEAKGGWILHSVECIPQRISRKKTLFEVLLGWIPILGNLIFPTMNKQCGEGKDFNLYVLVFKRES